MKSIAIYETKDGTRFDDQSKAEDYERLCEQVATAMLSLGNEPDIGDEEIHEHDPLVVAAAWEKFVAACRPTIDYYEGLRVPAASIHPMSFFGRVIDDSDKRVLRHANYRFCCIDKRGREWSQPYFAIQADKSA